MDLAGIICHLPGVTERLLLVEFMYLERRPLKGNARIQL